MPAQVLAFDTSSADFQKFLGALQQQCTDYGWKDVELKRFPWQYFRTTRQKRPITFVTFGETKGNCTLLLGAVHRDETPTVYLLLKLIQHLQDYPALYAGIKNRSPLRAVRSSREDPSRSEAARPFFLC